MVSRREFLGALAYPLVAGAVASLKHGVLPAAAADDRDFWSQIGRAFTVDRIVSGRDALDERGGLAGRRCRARATGCR